MEIGFIGALLILSAWVYETYRAIEKGEKLNVKFILIYLSGNILLTVYAISIKDMVFTVLNGAIGVMSLIELDLALRRRKNVKRKNNVRKSMKLLKKGHKGGGLNYKSRDELYGR